MKFIKRIVCVFLLIVSTTLLVPGKPSIKSVVDYLLTIKSETDNSTYLVAQEFRQAKFKSLDNETVDYLTFTREYKTVSEARRDYKRSLRHFRDLEPDEEWSEESWWRVLYFKSWHIYIARVRKTVVFEIQFK